MTRSRLVRCVLLVGLMQVPMLMMLPLPNAEAAGQLKNPAGVGSFDFMEYWAAHKLMRAGENPYDADLMLAVQQPQGLSGREPTMCWNPPWLITMLSPILGFSLRASARLWLGLGLVLATLVGLSIVATYRDRVRMSPGLLAAFFLFHPLLSSLSMEQIGMLYALSMAGFLLAASRHCDATAGLLLVPLTVKPHLVYLTLPLLAYWVVVQRRWRVLGGFAVGFMALVVATWTIYPGSIQHWIVAMSTRTPTHWIVGTLVGVTRLLFQANNSPAPTWPMVAIPGATAAAFCGWLAWRRPEPNLRRLLPGVLALSLFTSPYGWDFDQCQLLLIQVGLVALAARRDVPRAIRRSVWISLGAVQVAWTIERLLGFNQQHQFFWTSLALFAVWEYGMRKLRVIAWATPQPDRGFSQ